jgi:hypothetical protein
VLNARAAGRVRLRRGCDDREYEVREVGPRCRFDPEGVRGGRTGDSSLLQAKPRLAGGRLVAEADLHPVFELRRMKDQKPR